MKIHLNKNRKKVQKIFQEPYVEKYYYTGSCKSFWGTQRSCTKEGTRTKFRDVIKVKYDQHQIISMLL